MVHLNGSGRPRGTDRCSGLQRIVEKEKRQIQHDKQRHVCIVCALVRACVSARVRGYMRAFTYTYMYIQTYHGRNRSIPRVASFR